LQRRRWLFAAHSADHERSYRAIVSVWTAPS
jgi:hypothetical protein